MPRSDIALVGFLFGWIIGLYLGRYIWHWRPMTEARRSVERLARRDAMSRHPSGKGFPHATV